MAQTVDSYVRAQAALSAKTSRADCHYAYFAARSGISAKSSLADHQLATYRSVLGKTTGSLNDLRKQWVTFLSLEHSGGW